MEIIVIAKGKNNKYFAKGIFDGKGITVLKGSTIAPKVAERISPIVRRLRGDKDYVDNKNVLKKDIHFRSPSTAANFVTGNVSNGLKTWRNEHGVELNDIVKNSGVE